MLFSSDDLGRIEYKWNRLEDLSNCSAKAFRNQWPRTPRCRLPFARRLERGLKKGGSCEVSSRNDRPARQMHVSVNGGVQSVFIH